MHQKMSCYIFKISMRNRSQLSKEKNLFPNQPKRKRRLMFQLQQQKSKKQRRKN